MKKLIIIVLLLSILFLVACAAAPFEKAKCLHTVGAAWSYIPVAVSIDKKFSAQEQLELAEAANAWNQAYGMDLIVIRNDSSNYIQLGNHVFDLDKTLAETYFRYVGHEMYHVDIFYNDKWRYSGYDFESIMIHEFGHLLGLDHIESSPIMGPSIGQGEIERTIDKESLDAIECLYGPK